MKTLISAFLVIVASLSASLLLNARSVRGYEDVTPAREVIFQLTGYGTTLIPERENTSFQSEDYINDFSYWINDYRNLSAEREGDNEFELAWTEELTHSKLSLLNSGFFCPPCDILILSSHEN